jgi:hypothetical protein
MDTWRDCSEKGNLVGYARAVPVEIIAGVWLSGCFTGDIAAWCKTHNFTHILNAGGSHARTVAYNTKQSPSDINYMELEINDKPTQTLSGVLESSYNFIHDAIEKQGKILIHCVWGQSRSISCLIYFLMKHSKLSFDRAMTIIKDKKPTVRLDDAFERQLRSIDYEHRYNS